MTPCPSSTQLYRYATGELPPAEVEFIDRHVEGCLSCAERLADAAPFDDILQEVKDASQQETVAATEILRIEDVGPDRDPLIGQVIGDFEVRHLVGSGGMGSVYEAEQISLKRRVALKIMHVPLGARTAGVLRFGREAQAAARLHHTNIVSVFAQGQSAGLRYYAMEMIDGTGLDQVIREMRRRRESDRRGARWAPNPNYLGGVIRRWSASEGPSNGSDTRRELVELEHSDPRKRFDLTARLIADVAEALDYAHKHGVIHRDVKPSNMILSAEGRLSLTDFGLARMMEQPGMTIAGEFLGSPLYMSPEQVAAGRVPLDHRTDIYSLGATLYELLCLQPPYVGETREQVISQIREGRLRRPRKNDKRIPHDLETVCLKAMQRDPNHRYQTAGDMADDLRRFVQRYAIRARRAGLVTVTSKFIRRHAFETVMLAAVAIVLTGAGLDRYRLSRQNLQYDGELQLAQREANRLWDMRRKSMIQRSMEKAYAEVALCQFPRAKVSFGEVIRRAREDPSGYLARGLCSYLGEIMGFEAGRSGYADDFHAARERRPHSALLGLLVLLPSPSRASSMSPVALDVLIERVRDLDLEQVRDLTHGDHSVLYAVLSYVVLCGHRPEIARGLVDEALAAKPHLVPAHLIRSMILLNMRHYEEALANARAALTLLSAAKTDESTNLVSGYLLRASAFAFLGLPDEALRQSKRAMDLLAQRRARVSFWGPEPTSRPAPTTAPRSVLR